MKSRYTMSGALRSPLMLSLLLFSGMAASWASVGTIGGAHSGGAGGASIGAGGSTAAGTSGSTAISDAVYAGLDETTITALRADFTAAVESMAATEKAIRAMDARFPGDRLLWPPIARAYRASLEGLIGKHSPKLLEKFNRVNAAIADYSGLIEAHPESLELRFMRFAFYSQLPGLFGVGKHAAPDRAILTDMLERGNDDRVPDSQKLEMITWILKDGKPDKAETARLQSAAANLRKR